MKTIEVRESVFANNDATSAALRKKLKSEGTFLLNVMSSPGSGKTTLLSVLINSLKDKLKIALMDVDIESQLDANKVAKATGVPCVQIHNGGLCHIDAAMTEESIRQSGIKNVDLLVLENIGNLVCPAEFDTGAHLNMMLLSIPEGDDKPLKYPLMFSVCDVIIITKIDTLSIFNFDINKCKEYIHDLNPSAKVFEVSSKSGAGILELAEWLNNYIEQWKKPQ